MVSFDLRGRQKFQALALRRKAFPGQIISRSGERQGGCGKGRKVEA